MKGFSFLTLASGGLLLLCSKAFGSPLNIQDSFGLFGQGSVNPADVKPIPGDSPVQLCDAELPLLLEIDYVSIDPNPPVKGANLTISAQGYLKTTVVEGAYVDIEVRYGYIRLLQQTVDLCEELENVDMTCPVEKGKLKVKKQVELPNEIPPGKYSVVARAYTVDDEQLTCLSATVEFPYDDGMRIQI